MTAQQNQEPKIDDIPKSRIPEPEDVPEWFIDRIEQRVKDDAIEDIEQEDLQLTDEPESRIQALIKDVYETLRDNPSPDSFDKFYENSDLDEYNRIDLFAEFLVKVINKMGMTPSEISDINKVEVDELKTEEGCEKALKSIAEKVGEGDYDVEAVGEVIRENDTYSELVSKEKSSMDAEEYRAKYESHIEDEVRKWAEGMEQATEFQEFFDEWFAMKENSLDEMASRLNQTVKVGKDVWTLDLMAILSPHIPDYEIDGTKRRSSIHIMKIGDISTGKSQTIKLDKKLASKYDDPSGFTKAEFVGAFDPQEGEIQEGVVDRIQDGNLFIEEFDKFDLDEKVMRIVYDNGRLNEKKGGHRKEKDVNTSLIVGANPKNDFFLEKGNNMREQIPFEEGTLSRFDAVIPMMNTENDMKEIVDGMNLFGGSDDLDIADMKKSINALKSKCKSVKTVNMPEKLETTEGEEIDAEQYIKDKFKQKFKKIENSNRPKLIVTRDLGILVRFIYVDAVIRNEVEQGSVDIRMRNIRNGLGLFDTVIEHREKLYEENSRDKFNSTTKDEVYQKVIDLNSASEGEGVLKKDVIESCKSSGIINNKENGYYHINNLMDERKIVDANPEKDRYKKIKPVI